MGFSLQHPGIAQFHEEGPAELGKSKILTAKIIVAVADEEHGTGIDFVGKQQLSEDAFILVFSVFQRQQ